MCAWCVFSPVLSVLRFGFCGIWVLCVSMWSFARLICEEVVSSSENQRFDCREERQWGFFGLVRWRWSGQLWVQWQRQRRSFSFSWLFQEHKVYERDWSPLREPVYSRYWPSFRLRFSCCWRSTGSTNTCRSAKVRLVAWRNKIVTPNPSSRASAMGFWSWVLSSSTGYCIVSLRCWCPWNASATSSRISNPPSKKFLCTWSFLLLLLPLLLLFSSYTLAALIGTSSSFFLTSDGCSFVCSFDEP